jgi:hypothetical protein
MDNVHDASKCLDRSTPSERTAHIGTGAIHIWQKRFGPVAHATAHPRIDASESTGRSWFVSLRHKKSLY